MGEFMLDGEVIIADSDGHQHEIVRVNELLPRAFVPDSLIQD
jgi:cytidine deaminase